MTSCSNCNQLEGIKEYDDKLWDIYYRISDGRANYEALVYTREEFEDSWDDQQEENYATMSMERNMIERGLCPTCNRPNLAGVTDDMILSDEDLKEMAEMWAEEASERRAGC